MDPALLAAILQGAGGLLGSMGKGSSGSTGYDIVNFNDPQDATSRGMSSAYLQDILSSLRAGQTPDWMNRFTDPLQADLLRQNKNQMFGKEGSPGGSIADVALSTGAMTGLGGQAAQAPVNKALSDYADRMNGINQYIASIKNSYMTSASQTVPQDLYTMGRQQNQIVPITRPGSGSDPTMQGIGAALGGVDYSKLFTKKPATTQQPSGEPQYTPIIPEQQYTGQYVTPQSTSSTALNNIFPLTGRY